MNTTVKEKEAEKNKKLVWGHVVKDKKRDYSTRKRSLKDPEQYRFVLLLPAECTTQARINGITMK